MKLMLLAAMILGGCVVGGDGTGDGTGGGGGGGAGPDAGGGGGGGADASEVAGCQLPESADIGAVSALKAQRCNVPGSMGARQWYRLSASLPGAPADIVQLELWDGQGAFTGGKVRVGTFPISGAELSYATCGVCLRAIGDKGEADVKRYLATAGSIEITAVGINGAPISAKITNATFGEVDLQNVPVAAGTCSTASLTSATISGTVMDVGIGGGGGGGGGGGANNCPTTIGD